MFFCAGCQELKPKDNCVQFSCEHEICKICLYGIVKVGLDDVHNDLAIFKCPLCRHDIKITLDFVKTFDIPLTSFQLENAINPDHVSELCQRRMVEFTKNRFGRGTDEEFRVLVDDQKTNIRRAIMQGNLELIKWWLKNGSLYHLDIITLRQVWFNLPHINDPISIECEGALLRDLQSHDGEISSHKTAYSAHLKTLFFKLLEHKNISQDHLIFRLTHWKCIIEHLLPAHLQQILYDISRLKYLDVLTWWKQESMPVLTSPGIFNISDVQILSWWKNVDPFFTHRLPCNTIAITDINTLNWWRENSTSLYASDGLLLRAMTKNQLDTLNWWSEHFGLQIVIKDKFIKETIRVSSTTGDIKMFKWLMNQTPNTYPLSSSVIYMSHLICETVSHGFTNILDHLLDINKEEMIINFPTLVQFASKFSRTDILDWAWNYCKKENLPFVCSPTGIEKAFEKNQKKCLHWWIQWAVQNDQPFQINVEAVNGALRNGHYQLVEWWQKQVANLGWTLQYSSDMFVQAKSTKNLIHWLTSPKCQLDLNKLTFTHIEEISMDFDQSNESTNEGAIITTQLDNHIPTLFNLLLNTFGDQFRTNA